jgi:hypothetical protein
MTPLEYAHPAVGRLPDVKSVGFGPRDTPPERSPLPFSNHAPHEPVSRRPLAALALALVGGCASAAPDGGACPTGTSVSAASAEGRRLLGAAARYPADATLAERRDELHRSQRARRAAAWEAVARAVAPVHVAAVGDGATVPRFRTWYDHEDITRAFQRAAESLGAAGRRGRAPFSEALLDEAFAWNVRFAETLDLWPAARWGAYVESARDPLSLAGAAGLRRIALSPEAARHVVTSYAEVMRCVERGAPPAFVDGPAHSAQRLAREPFLLPRCGAPTFGPYFVASGARLEARVEGAAASRVRVRVLDGDGAARCTAPGDRGCALAGPGAFRVTLAAPESDVDGVLEVRHAAPGEGAAGCLRGVFPRDAAAVSMEWRRGDLGLPLPAYDSSARALARRLATPSPSWGAGDAAAAAPTPDSIYTAFARSGAVFVLAGMHLRTRELDRWMHITLWWSPDPDSDFGADRPASVRALGPPWDSYKMCVVTDFDEGDPDPEGGFTRDAPTLAAALRAVHEGRGAPSWCSNPYIDAGPGLVRSNCIGCHQHAMAGVRPAETVLDERLYPSAGRRQVRNNFPADQLWGLDTNDTYASIFFETLAWWAASDGP